MPTPKILATGLQFPEGPVIERDGSILIVEIERRTITRVKDGKSSIVAELPGFNACSGDVRSQRSRRPAEA